MMNIDDIYNIFKQIRHICMDFILRYDYTHKHLGKLQNVNKQDAHSNCSVSLVYVLAVIH